MSWTHATLNSQLQVSFCHHLSLSLFDSHSLFPHIYLFSLHLHFLSPNLSHFWSLFSSPFHLSFPQLFLAITSFVNTDLCNNVWCCFRDAVSARGGGVSRPGNSDEEPVHRQWHAHSATRGRPCQQVSTSAPQRLLGYINTGVVHYSAVINIWNNNIKVD